MSTFLALLASGIALGAIFALGALGFVVLYKATGVINFAQGDLTTLGAYTAVWAVDDLGLPLGLGYVFSVLALFAVGILLERVAYAPLRNRSIHIVVISTLGAAIVLRSLIGLWQGTTPVNLDSLAGDGVWRVFGAAVSHQRVLIIAVTALAVSGIVLAFDRTRVGRWLRALASDRETAQLVGINTGAMSKLAFGSSAALAGLAGVLVGPLTAIDLTLGFNIMLNSFAAAILGGFGSLRGVVVAGVLLGIVNQTVGSYLFPDFKDAYPFALMILVISVKPEGLFSTGEHSRL